MLRKNGGTVEEGRHENARAEAFLMKFVIAGSGRGSKRSRHARTCSGPVVAGHFAAEITGRRIQNGCALSW
jgi:hypothetical protein